MTETVIPGPPIGTVEGLRLRTRAGAGVARRSEGFWGRARFAADVVLLASAVTASIAAFPTVSAGVSNVFWGSLFAACVLGMLIIRGAYAPRFVVDFLEDAQSLLIAIVIATMTIVTLRVMLYTAPEDIAAEAFRLAVFGGVYLLCGRASLDLAQSRARRAGETVPTLIIGAGNVGHTTAKRLLEHPELGLRPVGFLDKEPRDDVASASQLPVLGASWDFEQVVRECGVGQVIVTFSTAPNDVLLRMIKRCEELGVGVSLVPRLYEKVTDRLTIDHLGGLPLLTAHPANPRGWQFTLKYALDRIGALLLLLILSPVLVVSAIAVRISLGRPIFFRQLRVGRDGRTFEMLKLRSMRTSWTLPEVEDEAAKLPDDTAPGGVDGEDRRTRVGAFLRNASIDELPQLLNVLKGDMSLIGPRPERPEYVELFESRVYRYGERHRVKSGITGWAQIHGLRGKTSLSDRVEWDNYYIENWSLWLDFKIALRTALAILGVSSKVK